MNTIDFDDTNCPVDFMTQIQEMKEFKLILHGSAATGLSVTFDIKIDNITEYMIHQICKARTMMGFSGLALFALSRGYRISGYCPGQDMGRFELDFKPRF